MLGFIRRIYDWMGSYVHSPRADYMLGFLFYLEAIFFLPTDHMLILYCIKRRERAFIYATIATAASVIGGITAYFIGAALWDFAGEQIIHNHWVNYVISPETFDRLSKMYAENEAWAILAAGFTPIPYKAATLSAGFFKLALTPFIFCSIIARGARFFLYASIIFMFGTHIEKSIDRYFNAIMVVTVLIIIGTIWMFT